MPYCPGGDGKNQVEPAVESSHREDDGTAMDKGDLENDNFWFRFRALVSDVTLIFFGTFASRVNMGSTVIVVRMLSFDVSQLFLIS